jgi:uncharacterized protein (UPF0261 family)
MMHSVTDILGLNPILRKVLANAAGAICGMAEVEVQIERSANPVVCATMFGNTTPCVMHARAILAEKGYEVVVFHPNGTGGPAMEELIDLGLADAVLDLTTHEVAGELFGGLMGAPHRLEAAARRGIPQVIGPGAVDYLVVGKPEEVPPEHRHRKYYRHSREFGLVRVEPHEMVEIAKTMAARLNRSRGPVAVAVPLRGFSFPAREGGPTYDPAGDKAFAETMRAHLAPGIRYVEVDCHINDPPYAETAVALLEEMITRHKTQDRPATRNGRG